MARVAMDLKFLEFEQPIAELEARIDALKFVGEDSEINISEEISRLRNKSESLTRSIFSNLTAWQIAQLARHPQRPYMLDYVDKCFTTRRGMGDRGGDLPRSIKLVDPGRAFGDANQHSVPPNGLTNAQRELMSGIELCKLLRANPKLLTNLTAGLKHVSQD